MMTRLRRPLLWAGIVAPILALATAILATLLFPGFNHATQFLSELGGPKAIVPAVFNGGVILAGVAAALAGLGFTLAMLALGGARLPAVLTGLAFVLGAVGLIMASLYPWPDPRHQAVNLGLGIQLAPIFILWSLARVEGVGRLRGFLAVVLVAMAFLTVMTKHLVLPGTVNDANVGWWERAFALVLVGWVGVTAVLLERRLLAAVSKDADAEPRLAA